MSVYTNMNLKMRIIKHATFVTDECLFRCLYSAIFFFSEVCNHLSNISVIAWALKQSTLMQTR